MSPMWIIIDLRLRLLNDERKSIDWPLHHRPSSPFLCWSHFKERQSFLLLLLVLLLLFFLFIRPLQLNDAFCFNNGVLVKESTSCFNDLARSIRRFVVTTSHREFVYTHMYSTSTCREIREENCSSSSSSLPALTSHHYSRRNSFNNRLRLRQLFSFSYSIMPSTLFTYLDK